MVYAPDLNALLVEGHRQTLHRKWEFVVESCAELAPVVLPSGRVVACDALGSEDDEPFTVTLPPGTYAMYAWVATVWKRRKEMDVRNAALELRIGDAPTVSWEMALTDGESVEGLEGEEDFVGFSVDAGCGTLADVEALRALRTWDFDRIESVYIPKPLPQKPAPGYISAVVDPDSGANVSVVGSGWGDGLYPTFIGRDADGAVTRFVTDFMLRSVFRADMGF